jgi:xanthine dehydrogenase accessory factor
VLHLATTPSGDNALQKGHVLYDARAAVLLMTHNFHRDAELLAKIVRTGIGYVGVLGPRRRTERLLVEAGMPAGDPSALHAPPGLDVGGETPEEIALSLLAEVQGHFAGRAGGKLRDRAAPIHDRIASAQRTPPLAASEREP